LGRDSSVSIGIRYGLDGPGIEFRWGRDVPHPFKPALGVHPVSYTMGTGSFPGVKSGRGVALTTHPHLGQEVKEKVDLYLYSPFGSSWPLLGWRNWSADASGWRHQLFDPFLSGKDAKFRRRKI